MDSTSQKWLIGCGSGCAIVIVFLVFIVGGAIVFVRDKVRPLQEASDSRREIVAAYGAVHTFVPPPDGTIGTDRMEVFISVRDSLRGAQDHLDATLSNVDFGRMTQRKQSLGDVLRILNDVGNLIVPVGEYMGRRNRALLDRHMGLGEYAYIYTIAYHSWLGHPPEEGPRVFAELSQRNRQRHSGDTGNFTPEAIRGQYRRLIVRLLENQLGGMKDPVQKSLRDMVQQEIERVDRSLDRVAWQDNLPSSIEACLKPYRSRLESTYRTSTNCFELLTLDESRQYEWDEPTAKVEPGPKEEPVQVEAPPEGTARASAGTGGGTGGARAIYSVSYTVGSGVTAPVAVVQPMPAYTDAARQGRVEGVVTIQAIIRKDGSVGNAKVVRRLGYGLDQSAVNTITRDWRFRPASLNGKPVDVQTNIDVTFRP